MLVLTEVSSAARQCIAKQCHERDEGQPFQMVGHEGLTFRDPDAAQVSNILALLLKRLQVFFMRQSEATQNPPDGGVS